MASKSRKTSSNASRKHLRDFMDSLCDDIKGILSLYETSYLGFEGEKILDEARAFTTNYLKEYLKQGEIEPIFKEQVVHIFLGASKALEVEKDVIQGQSKSIKSEARDTKSLSIAEEGPWKNTPKTSKANQAQTSSSEFNVRRNRGGGGRAGLGGCPISSPIVQPQIKTQERISTIKRIVYQGWIDKSKTNFPPQLDKGREWNRCSLRDLPRRAVEAHQNLQELVQEELLNPCDDDCVTRIRMASNHLAALPR
ncbi:hypothetical protein QJS10_CPB22g00253 [Acorus calamus]|uniref:Terpene synthase N-terminal domain-containing protein n=1 Tax=Acorus calamus TaxID=4465 RepID=A0AAV9C2C7_ACOCL|nr:hypothetical protein QJS10_CPB22g00253 [Acorus calamus]